VVPASQVRLGLGDAGFVWGATVTDLVRTFRLQPFRLHDHIGRFRRGCNLVGIRLTTSNDLLAKAAGELIEQNGRHLPPGGELVLVLAATPGEIGYYTGQPGGAGEAPPTLVLHTFPLPFQRYARLVTEGARLLVPSVRQLTAASVPPQVKHRSRLHFWLAEQEARATDPHATPLLLDAEGFVTEAPSANFLVVRSGRVQSPRRSRVLGGISLRVTEEFCRQLGIPFEEQDLKLDDCLGADEAMLTSTAYGLAPVARLGDRSFPAPGPLAARLREAWNRLAGLDIAGQILSRASA
jgi:branched-subunit amino acid aminotransferase/4-amino-4-deoxychorismate lyase